MPGHVKKPTVLNAAGNLPKTIEEFIGRVNTGTEAVSIARMKSPAGWEEPGQTPEFAEYTVVLSGTLSVTTKDAAHEVRAGEAFIAPVGEWVRYSTPEGAEYISVCLPAFSPEMVRRDNEGDAEGCINQLDKSF